MTRGKRIGISTALARRHLSTSSCREKGTAQEVGRRKGFRLPSGSHETLQFIKHPEVFHVFLITKQARGGLKLRFVNLCPPIPLSIVTSRLPLVASPFTEITCRFYLMVSQNDTRYRSQNDPSTTLYQNTPAERHAVSCLVATWWCHAS